MATNDSIKELHLWDTDLMVMENVEQWVVTLTTNKTIETLGLKGVEAEVVKN